MEQLFNRLLARFLPTRRNYTFRGVQYRAGEKVIARTTDPEMPLIAGVIRNFYDFGGQWMSAGIVIECDMGTMFARNGVISPYNEERYQHLRSLSYQQQWDTMAPEQQRRKEKYGHVLSLG